LAVHSFETPAGPPSSSALFDPVPREELERGTAVSDVQEQAPEQDGSEVDQVDHTSGEIARSLGTVWRRFSGQRPKSTSVEIRQNSVKCVIQEGSPDAEADEDEEGLDDERLSAVGLKQNATAAITRITGRRVVAFIPKRDKKTEISTQTFLLERPQRRF
jgi:hypothetical protein